MATFLPWVGGKTALLPEIIPRLPSKIGKYIEPFGGGAAVLLEKPRSKQEVYNDYQRDLVNLFQVVRDRPLAFLNTMELIPINSREEFKMITEILSGKIEDFNYLEDELSIAQKVFSPSDFEEIKALLTTKAEQHDVHRAALFYKSIIWSYGSRGTSYGSRVISLHSLKKNIHHASHRLRRVVIENRDFEDLIKSHDSQESFFYCDPPYYETERSYNAEFYKQDHERLKECLSDLKGQFLLSYNDCDYIQNLYQGYYKVSVSRLNNLKQRYEAGSVFPELLIANYDITKLQNHKTYQPTLWEDPYEFE